MPPCLETPWGVFRVYCCLAQRLIIGLTITPSHIHLAHVMSLIHLMKIVVACYWG